jgi:hypothetical protein
VSVLERLPTGSTTSVTGQPTFTRFDPIFEAPQFRNAFSITSTPRGTVMNSGAGTRGRSGVMGQRGLDARPGLRYSQPSLPRRSYKPTVLY